MADTIGVTSTGFGAPKAPPEPIWPRPAPPASLPEQPLQVLAGRDQQCLGVDLPEPSEPEAAQPVPVLGLAEERLDPHAALAEGLLVGGRALVRADAVDVVRPEGAGQGAAQAAVGALSPHGAGGADRPVSAVDPGLDAVGDVVAAQGLPEAIISDRDSRFTSYYWKALWEGMGAELVVIL